MYALYNVRIFNTVLHISGRRDWRARVWGWGRDCAQENRSGGGVFEYSDGGAQRTAAVIPTPAIYHAGDQRTRFIPTGGRAIHYCYSQIELKRR